MPLLKFLNFDTSLSLSLSLLEWFTHIHFNQVKTCTNCKKKIFKFKQKLKLIFSLCFQKIILVKNVCLIQTEARQVFVRIHGIWWVCRRGHRFLVSSAKEKKWSEKWFGINDFQIELSIYLQETVYTRGYQKVRRLSL